MLLRVSQNDALMARVFGFPKMYSFFFLRLPSMPSNLVLIFQIRGLLPFSGLFSIEYLLRSYIVSMHASTALTLAVNRE